MVPITLVGTGDLMPNAKEYLLYPGKVQVSSTVVQPRRTKDALTHWGRGSLRPGTVTSKQGRRV